jgi:hypothetical protein
MRVPYNSGKKQRITCSSTCVSPCATTPTRSRNSSSDHSHPASCPPASTKRSDDTTRHALSSFPAPKWPSDITRKQASSCCETRPGKQRTDKARFDVCLAELVASIERGAQAGYAATQGRRATLCQIPIPLLSHSKKRSRASNGRRVVATHSMLTSHACAYRHNHIRPSSSSSSSSFFLLYIHIYRQTKHPHPHLIYKPDESYPPRQ